MKNHWESRGLPENTTIQELDKDKFTADEVLQILKDDYTKLKNLAIDIRNTADDGRF